MKKDALVGLGAIFVAIFFFYFTSSIKVPSNIVDPGPRFFPYIAELLIVICGIGMIVESRNKEEKPFLSKIGWKKLGFAFLVLILYAIALTYVGFLIATPFMHFTLVNMLSGEKKIPTYVNVILSVVVTLFLYIVFAKGFSVMLPPGKLF